MDGENLFNGKKSLKVFRWLARSVRSVYEAIEEFIDYLEQSFQDSGRKEIATTEIGELVMAKLHEWDDVAYVRFASVYRQFKDPGDFVLELKELLESRKKKETKKKKK